MARGIAEVEFQELVDHVLDNWKRTALANFDQGVTVADPGHGRDEISPVTVVGIPFNPDQAEDASPFTPQELRDHQVAGTARAGCGFIVLELRPIGRPTVLVPGPAPEMREDVLLEVTIITPGRNGPALANSYAGALSMIFRYVYLTPAGGGGRSIQNTEPPNERPSPQGDDGTWRYDLWRVPLTRIYRAEVADGSPA